MTRVGTTQRFTERPLFKYPAFSVILDVLMDAVEMSFYLPNVAIVTGLPGVGKTALSHYVKEQINEKYGSQLAHRVQLKSVNSETDIVIQAASGLFEIPPKVSPAQKLDCFCSSFANQGHKVLIIDEAQHMLAQSNGKHNQKYSDFIKVLADADICVLLFGVEDAASLYTTENYSMMVKGQVESRGMALCKMPVLPNKLNERDAEGERKLNPWKKVIEYYQRYCKMPVVIDLACDDILNKLYTVTKGNFRTLERIFTLCHVRYEQGKSDNLDENLLYYAVKRDVTRLDSQNPFSSKYKHAELAS